MPNLRLPAKRSATNQRGIAKTKAAQRGSRDGTSQTVKALLELRNVILNGELAAGERLSELTMVQRLKVSRTPVRAALQKLSEEGLLEPIATGGYSVKAFTEREIHDAIELRGTLEGLAARFAAERGASPMQLADLKECSRQIEALTQGSHLAPDLHREYVRLNERFHDLIIELANSRLLAREIERMTQLPFASPNGFIIAQFDSPRAHMILAIAHDQHRSVIEAIEQREGARAEALMREHARLAHRSLRLALRNQQTTNSIRGGALIQRRS